MSGSSEDSVRNPQTDHHTSAVARHRTPKHARVLPCSCVGCLAHPSRVSSESGSCRVSIRLGISTLQSVFECRPVGSLSRHLKGSAALQNSVYTGIHPELRSRTPRTTSQRGRGAAFTPLHRPMTRDFLSPQTMRTRKRLKRHDPASVHFVLGPVCSAMNCAGGMGLRGECRVTVLSVGMSSNTVQSSAL